MAEKEANEKVKIGIWEAMARAQREDGVLSYELPIPKEWASIPGVSNESECPGEDAYF